MSWSSVHQVVGRIYPGERVTHDPQRIQELDEIRRVGTVGELTQFLHTAN